MTKEKKTGQYQFLELLARGGTLTETLRQLLRVIEQQVPDMLGLILLLDEDGRHLHAAAAPSLPQAYLDSIEGLEIGPMVGSCGTACYTGERVIVSDIATDPRWDGLRALALDSGLRACWSEPVLSAADQVVGTLAMYYRKPRAPTAEELELIAMGAHLVGVAVERKRADEALRESERRLSTLMSTLPGMAYRCANDHGWPMAFVSHGCLELTGYAPADLIGNRTVAYGDLIHLDDYERVWQGVQTALDERRPFELTYRLHTANDAEKWVWERGRGVYGDDGAVLALEGFISDITERVMAEQLLERRVKERTREAERRAEEARTLFDVQQAITRRLDEEGVLQLIADGARRLTGARGAVVFLLENGAGGEKGWLRAAVTSGEQGEPSSGARLPLAGSLVEQAIRNDAPLSIENATADPHVQADARRLKLLEQGNVHNLLIAPLIAEHGPLGAISLSDKRPPSNPGQKPAERPASQVSSFDEPDRQLLKLLASSAVVGLENVRLYREVQERAVQEERSRLARDLHDSVTQSLYSLTLFAEAARQMVNEKEDGALARHLQRIGEIGQQSLKEMRLLVYELRPPALAEQGLISALRQRLEAVEGRAGVDARLVVADLVSLPTQTEEALYRITQEALNNVLKHARASTVIVTLRCEEGSCENGGFRLEVVDDGLGFEPDRSSGEGGQGLGNIKERAAALGATVEIASEPGAGTRLAVQGPI